MAKVNRKKSKTVKKAPGKAANAVKPVQATVPAAVPEKKKSLVPVIIAGLLFVFTIGEILFVTKESMRKQKKPEFVRMWDHRPYTGIFFLNEFGDSLYGVDETRGQVIQFNKLTGQLGHVYNVEGGVRNCVVDSAMNMNILDKKGVVHRFNRNFTPKDTITPALGGTAIWIEVDSKGNMYLADGQDNTIHKYGPDFKEILVFDKSGEGKSKYNSLIKLFAGPNDDLYCLAALPSGKKGVVIFGSDGQFKKAWPLKNVKAWSNLDHLAITPQGQVYLNCSADNNIYVYDNNGKMLSKFDTCKNNGCVITYPGSVSGGMSGQIYIYSHQILTLKNIEY